MSTFSDVTDATELVAILIGVYLLSSFLKTAKNTLFQDVGAELGGLQPWVATTTPLTAQHADSLARFIGVDLHGGGWKLSPDQTQIWFNDGSFFDNKTGHFFDAAGNDQGDLLGNPGAPASGTPLDGIDTSSMDAATMAGFSA